MTKNSRGRPHKLDNLDRVSTSRNADQSQTQAKNTYGNVEGIFPDGECLRTQASKQSEQGRGAAIHHLLLLFFPVQLIHSNSAS